MSRTTHLATVESEVYERSYERFKVKRPARLIAVKPCLTGVTMRSAEIIEISRGGATCLVGTTIGLPLHYYLNILGLNYRIGCAEISRMGDRIGVRFINTLTPEMLRQVIRTDFLIGNTEAAAARNVVRR
jgi:hypothetical protein